MQMKFNSFWKRNEKVKWDLKSSQEIKLIVLWQTVCKYEKQTPQLRISMAFLLSVLL